MILLHDNHTTTNIRHSKNNIRHVRQKLTCAQAIQTKLFSHCQCMEFANINWVKFAFVNSVIRCRGVFTTIYARIKLFTSQFSARSHIQQLVCNMFAICTQVCSWLQPANKLIRRRVSSYIKSGSSKLVNGTIEAFCYLSDYYFLLYKNSGLIC